MLIIIVKHVAIMILIAGINLMFKDASVRRRYKNTLQNQTYDSAATQRYDSLLSKTRFR